MMNDNIVIDLLTRYRFGSGENQKTVTTRGGLLGHWCAWTHTAVKLFRQIKALPEDQAVPKELLELADFTSEVKNAMTPGKTRYIIHDEDKGMQGLVYPQDYTGYYEIEKRVDGKFEVMFLDKGVSVRIGGRKQYKTFQVTETDGFRTYDDGNCGEY